MTAQPFPREVDFVPRGPVAEAIRLGRDRVIGAIMIFGTGVLILLSIIAFYTVRSQQATARNTGGIAQARAAADHAVTAANNALDQSKQNQALLKGQVADKDKIIGEKDAELAAKDQALGTQTTIIGQIYNAAIKLQEQVQALKGQPVLIPVTIPGPAKPGAAGAAITPLPSPSPSTSGGVTICPGVQLPPVLNCP